MIIDILFGAAYPSLFISLVPYPGFHCGLQQQWLIQWEKREEILCEQPKVRSHREEYCTHMGLPRHRTSWECTLVIYVQTTRTETNYDFFLHSCDCSLKWLVIEWNAGVSWTCWLASSGHNSVTSEVESGPCQRPILSLVKDYRKSLPFLLRANCLIRPEVNKGWGHIEHQKKCFLSIYGEIIAFCSYNISSRLPHRSCGFWCALAKSKLSHSKKTTITCKYIFIAEKHIRIKFANKIKI